MNDDLDQEKCAQALIALAESAQCLPRVRRELPGVLDLVEGDPRMRRFLLDPSVRTAGKESALREILGTEIHPVLLHFLLLLQHLGQIGRLARIAEAFFRGAAGREDKVAGEITAAQPLSESDMAAIEKEASRLLGKTVSLSLRLDPGLLGGCVLKAGDMIVDGTVERRLEDLRRQLLA